MTKQQYHLSPVQVHAGLRGAIAYVLILTLNKPSESSTSSSSSSLSSVHSNDKSMSACYNYYYNHTFEGMEHNLSSTWNNNTNNNNTLPPSDNITTMLWLDAANNNNTTNHTMEVVLDNVTADMTEHSTADIINLTTFHLLQTTTLFIIFATVFILVRLFLNYYHHPHVLSWQGGTTRPMLQCLNIRREQANSNKAKTLFAKLNEKVSNLANPNAHRADCSTLGPDAGRGDPSSACPGRALATVLLQGKCPYTRTVRPGA